MKRLLPVICLLSWLIARCSFAGSATWSLNPISDDWDTAANWTPATVPRGQFDVATFASSDAAQINVSHATGLEGIVFAADADPFTITIASNRSLDIRGGGVTNNSGQTQQFVVGGILAVAGNESTGADIAFTTLAGGSISFVGRATLGRSVSFDIASGSSVIFDKGASAGDATFIIDGAAAFSRQATAEHATFVVTGGQTVSAPGGALTFARNARAGDAIITVKGAAVAGATPGLVYFNVTGSAENATLVADGGLAGGPGGIIRFQYLSRGTTGRVELRGNSVLDASNSALGIVRVGSLEGTGTVLLGADLSVGENGLSTTFSGVLQGGQTLEKVGTGTLTLTGANTHVYTVIRRGAVMANNRSGSATGTGEVEIGSGGLGGSGTLTGPVVVGYVPNSRLRTFLAPGATGKGSIGTLTVQSNVTFAANSTYDCEIDVPRLISDQLVTAGVTIDSGTQIDLVIHGNQLLTVGTSFTIISNTASTPISGTFSNLIDGATVTFGSNTYQANYEGGDGNDLTLTVVQ